MTPSPLVSIRYCFRCVDEQLDRAFLSTTFLFRRRSNENYERDVPRHDVISFGVEPPRRALVQGVFEHAEHSFEDGLTRRSPKLAQRAFAAALASRGALRDLASKTDD